jgi:hypothetical protein
MKLGGRGLNSGFDLHPGSFILATASLACATSLQISRLLDVPSSLIAIDVGRAIVIHEHESVEDRTDEWSVG